MQHAYVDSATLKNTLKAQKPKDIPAPVQEEEEENVYAIADSSAVYGTFYQYSFSIRSQIRNVLRVYSADKDMNLF